MNNSGFFEESENLKEEYHTQQVFPLYSFYLRTGQNSHQVGWVNLQDCITENRIQGNLSCWEVRGEPWSREPVWGNFQIMWVDSSQVFGWPLNYAYTEQTQSNNHI